MKPTPRLSTVYEVLAYLRTSPPRSPPGTANELRIERVGAGAMWLGYAIIALTFTAGFLLSREAPLSVETKQHVALFVSTGYACMLVRIGTLLYLLWAGRHDWRRRVADQRILRDEAHARPLTACPESLLRYAREWVQRQLARSERRSATLMKDLGLIPAVALLYAAFQAWQSVHAALHGVRLVGLPLDALTPMMDALFWASLLTMVVGLLASRLAAMRYAHRVEILDIALSLQARFPLTCAKRVPSDGAPLAHGLFYRGDCRNARPRLTHARRVVHRRITVLRPG